MTLTVTPGPHGLCFDPDAARRHLIAADPVLGRLIERVGPFAMRAEPTKRLFVGSARMAKGPTRSIRRPRTGSAAIRWRRAASGSKQSPCGPGVTVRVIPIT